MEILTSVVSATINVFLEEDQQVERSISFKTQGFDFSRLNCYQATFYDIYHAIHEKLFSYTRLYFVY